MVEHDQAALFLQLLRTCVVNDFRFERRPENMATLVRFGMRIPDARSHILTLATSDYVCGPTPRPGNSSQEAWVFGVTIQRTLVYVKLCVRVEPARCVCVSFHEAERPMVFPYSRRSEEKE